MSDTIYKIFPKNYSFLAADDRIEGSVSLLKPFINGAPIKWEKYDNPAFVDCGSNLESISCPFCQSHLLTEDWQNMMDKCFASSNFNDLTVIVPCCNKQTTLNDLIYDCDCGFARFVIEILNPGEYYPRGHELYEAGKAFWCSKDFGGYKMIVAHY